MTQVHPSAGTAVECRSLCKDFGDGDRKNRVLNALDLTISDSEMTLIVGPSGCGKTTLISIIAGLLRPSSGGVSIFETDLLGLSDDGLVDFRCNNLGFVFQSYNLLPALSAVENAAVPLIIQGIRRSHALARAREMLSLLGLGKRADARPSQLSGGEQQRVAFARALVHDPRLLVCDEPTAALDASAGRLVMGLLRDSAVKPGRAVIVVTHDSRVYEYGDTIIHICDGRAERTERRGGDARRASRKQGRSNDGSE
jgi:putative ABC transport system ATP-binding protein